MFNWKGNCNYIPAASININSYINSYNTFASNCNANTDFDAKSKFFIDTYIDNIIDIDCEEGINYNFTKQCGLREIYSVLDKCKTDVPTSTPPLYFLYNMPLSCPFLGLASKNEIWLQGSKLVDPLFANILAHEYGHTYGLLHARAEGSTWEYADCSDPMGCASTVNVCFNAPNSNKIGWAKPIIIKASFLKPKILHNFFLPIFSTTFANNIQFQFNSSSLFLSLRSSEGKLNVDSGILGLQLVNYKKRLVSIQNAISIHSTNETTISNFLDAVQPHQTWKYMIPIELQEITLKYVEYVKGKGALINFCFQCS